MSKLNLSINHSLSKEIALERTKKLLEETKRKHADKISNLKESWVGNTGNFSFTAMGFDISGTLNVGDKNIELFGNIPWAATLFEGRIKSVILEEATKLLS